MKTLLVEDDRVTRDVLEQILRSRGYDVTACADAEAGWSAYQRTAYPLVVLDWLLPGMDGLQLCRQMRALPHGDRSVVVVVTARDQPEDLQAVLDAGADDYLAKPVDTARLGVRLAIAEQQVRHLAQRKDAEAKIAEMMRQIERSRDDLLSVLNQLRVGSALTDEEGRVTFLNRTCEHLFRTERAGLSNRRWEQVFPFPTEEMSRLKEMVALPPAQRQQLAAHVDAPGRRYSVDVEVQDDPRDPRRKIFFLYDVSEVHDLRRLLREKAQFHDLVGKSDSMLVVYQQIRDVAAVDSTVLIEGETGTGKELVARAIHFSSQRRAKPFIAMNCAGLTESLLGSQLFGHKRGAFTGAMEDHKGLFEAAHGGTLFLDEVGDIPATVQTNLLRVLQEREIVRLGESTPRKIDVRVLAATHHDLAQDVTRGTFRADLLYRIRVARIHLPPLRERREDIPLLAASFLGACRAATGKPVEELSQDAMRALLGYAWPGNVRELKSAIEFAVIRCKGPVIEVTDLPAEIVGDAALPASAGALGPGLAAPAGTADAEARQDVLDALEAAKGNRALAARLLGISRATLYRRLAELNIPAK